MHSRGKNENLYLPKGYESDEVVAYPSLQSVTLLVMFFWGWRLSRDATLDITSWNPSQASSKYSSQSPLLPSQAMPVPSREI